jgi:hypothetical protein
MGYLRRALGAEPPWRRLRWKESERIPQLRFERCIASLKRFVLKLGGNGAAAEGAKIVERITPV